MKDPKYKVGDKVVPIAKTAGVIELYQCDYWRLALYDKLNYLYIVAIDKESNDSNIIYVCNSSIKNGTTGNQYNESDLIPYVEPIIAPVTGHEVKFEKTVLDEAKDLIYGDREKDYGSASKNFENISKMWSVILGKEISTEEVIQCMIALKQCRLINQPGHKDSWVDICGYVGVWDKIKKGL